MRYLIAAIVALFGLICTTLTTSNNPVTGEKQHVRLTVEQEVALGRQLAPQMAAQFGGVSTDKAANDDVSKVGASVVAQSRARTTPYQFRFNLLADRNTVNAFALPGGQIFITEALLSRLRTRMRPVLGHEVGHVLARHSAEHLAKEQLTQSMVGAVVIGSGGGYNTAQLAQLAGSMINMKYGRDDESEADSLGLRLMQEAQFDPRAMIGVMQTLERASGGSRQPEFASTHPNPGNRIAHIKAELAKMPAHNTGTLITCSRHQHSARGQRNCTTKPSIPRNSICTAIAVNSKPINRSSAMSPRSPIQRLRRSADSRSNIEASTAMLSAAIHSSFRSGARDISNVTVATDAGPAIAGIASGTMKGSPLT